jgi:deazaflavin-dependent oxidoreductase (nitroreductase family)
MAMSHQAHAEEQPRVPFFVPLFNPVARRLLGAGIPLGPNALLTVRGRKSGLLRTTPVAVVDIDGRRWIISTFGEVNWARNLRADPEATIRIKGRELKVRATELSVAERASFFRDVLRPYVKRIPLGSFLIGRMLGAREILADPEEAANKHPVFELVLRS